jgi:hypothetical protein
MIMYHNGKYEGKLLASYAVALLHVPIIGTVEIPLTVVGCGKAAHTAEAFF